MHEWLEKKSIQFILVVVVLLIWGYNTYSIVGVAADEDSMQILNQKAKINIENWEIPETGNKTYTANFPDPFEPKIISGTPKKAVKEPEKPKEEIKPPSLSLTGILDNMALVKSQNNRLYFVSVGDTVEGARIQAVHTDSVRLTFESQKIILKLNN